MLIYDWLSVTTKIHTLETVLELFGLDSVEQWEHAHGVRGYADRLYIEGISIHYNGHSPDMGIWIEMSGKGCRAFETFGHGDYDSIFRPVMDNPSGMNLTRLDVAFDDKEGIFDMKTLTDDTFKHEYVSKSREWECVIGSRGYTINHGSKSSCVFIRIYDKAMERKVEGHWIRFELMLRDEMARSFIILTAPLGEKFCGVVNNYLRYIVPDDTQTNTSRLKTKKYWQRFLGEAEKIRLYHKADIDYNRHGLEQYIHHQALNSISTYIEINGGQKLLDIAQANLPHLKDRQKQLISRHKVLDEKSRVNPPKHNHERLADFLTEYANG